jgi:DNA-binding HxlR family transcriptional regulator
MSNRSVTTTATTATATSIKNKVEQITNPSDHVKMKSCPIDNTFKIIGKKFTVLILRNMINGKQNRFN